MDSLYQKLTKKKINSLQGHKPSILHNKEIMKQLPYMTCKYNTNKTQSGTNMLNWGFDYTIEKNPKYFISALIVDTENTVRYPDVKIQNTFRYPAARKIKQITEINTHNILHKRYEYSLKQIKILREQNNLMTAKAGKGRTMVIIHKDALKQKISTF